MVYLEQYYSIKVFYAECKALPVLPLDINQLYVFYINNDLSFKGTAVWLYPLLACIFESVKEF